MMFNWIPAIIESAVETTTKVVVEAVQLPMKCGEAIWDGISKGSESEDDE